MSYDIIGTREFAFEDQLRFASLSGDRNPMHVDPVAARRTVYGDVVVHGVHVSLWALDCLLSTRTGPRTIAQLRTEFRGQVSLGEAYRCELVDDADEHFSLSISGRRGVVATLTGALHRGDPPGGVEFSAEAQPLDCREATLDELVSASGALPLHVDSSLLSASFPALASRASVLQVAEILATTRLVGMECPGLHSVYSSFELRLHDHRVARDLSYHTVKVDRRFSLLQIAVRGPTLEGRIDAFVRPAPVAQPSVDTVARTVAPHEFLGERAIVIGGSRGLGEITAKIITAGGGAVRVSYHLGKAEASTLCNDIRVAGGDCASFALDVTCGNDTALRDLARDWLPTQVYYFATPHIALQRGALFEPVKFHRYAEYYVDGFTRSVLAVLESVIDPLAVFYPSTVFLDKYERNSTEYCAAKAAGELVCRHIEASHMLARMHAPRLPRTRTDNTASGFIPVRAADALDVMLPVIRRMRQSRGASSD